MTASVDRSRSGFEHLLTNSGFQALLWTQFLGVFNDGLYITVIGGMQPGFVALALVFFVTPFVLFSGYAGQLADRTSKRTALIGANVFGIAAVGCAVAALYSNRLEAALAGLFLMGLRSAAFNPAKCGMIPELAGGQDFSRAEAFAGTWMCGAIALGVGAGVFLAQPWRIGAAMLAVAVLGLAYSLRIPRGAAGDSLGRFSMNPFGGTLRLFRDRPVRMAVIGISYFWFLAALLLGELLVGGKPGSIILALIGAGVGCLLAGRLSGEKPEVGLVPLGSMLIGLGTIGIWYGTHIYAAALVVGLGGGLSIVPMHALLDRRGDGLKRGRLAGAGSFYSAVGVLLACGVVRFVPMAPEHLILVAGLATLGVAVYLIWLMPEFVVRFVMWMGMHTIYDIRIIGAENVPSRGAALLVSNHVTHLDGFFIGACIQRFVRFMVWKPYYDMKVLNTLLRFAKAIPVGTSGPRDVIASLRAGRAELEAGHAVCIFAEGAITRTGNLLPFKRGMERMVDGLDVPIIPVHLDRLWGSIFSYEKGRFFTKWPKRIPYRVTVSFGEPLPAATSIQAVRQAVSDLASKAMTLRKSGGDVLARRFVRSARRNWSRLSMADSTGRELKYGQALAASLLVAGWARKQSSMVGVMLPASVDGALANIGLTMAGKIPVNLNVAGDWDTILTSKAFLDDACIEKRAGMVFIEDVLGSAGSLKKAWATVCARLGPAWVITKKTGPDSPAAVVFSNRNGVRLSHYNVISSVEAMAQVFRLDSKDRIAGGVPLPDALGLTGTVWLPLITGCGAVYHSNPMDAEAMGELIAKYKTTFLVSAPALSAGYARACAREQFASLRYALAISEKIEEPVSKAFVEAFGRELFAGYGCAGMSGVVSVNGPSYIAGRDSQMGSKAGTAGLPLPGVSIRIVDPETREILRPDQEGMVMARGANLMMDYLGDAGRTAEAIEDGWYRTGELGAVDEEGFLRLTGRCSRSAGSRAVKESAAI